MLKGISFKKLFSRFDYEINLKETGISILTGPNGYGKSTVLKCIEALYKEKYLYFLDLDFEEISFSFEEGYNLTLKKTNEKLAINDVEVFLDKKIVFVDTDRGEEEFYYRRLEREFYKEVLDWIDEDDDLDLFQVKNMFNNVHSSQFRFWKLFKFSDSKSPNQVEKEKITQVIRYFFEAKELLGDVHFIKEQRLLQKKLYRNDEKKFSAREERETIIDVIEDIPKLLKKHIDDVSNSYSAKANELDSSYPTRLFGMKTGINEEEYRYKMSELSSKFEKLKKYDISSLSEDITNVSFKKDHAIALKVYFEDFGEKYKEYEDFIKRLDLFTSIINNRLSFKEIKISRDLGIRVIDEDFTEKELSLNLLSSGEKQEIVMFYELIFEADNNTLLLIDEPEISLHIVWQKKFMDDILEIIKHKGFKVIVATHSPQIINNHWDLQIDLGELYGKQLNSR